MKFISRIFLVLAGTALMLTACEDGSDAGAGGEIRPFAEVQANDFTFENDPTFPGRAIFRVVTTEPMICSITWGPTEALGNQNNSLAMNGTGIIDHDVLLPGAQAGETYFFQVQGSNAAGEVFQSELATFTLPTRPEAAVGDDMAQTRGDNLALAASVVDVSSEFSAAWAGTNAIDGDLSTEWSSSGDGDNAFITIDLGSPREVDGIEFITRSMADGSATANDFFVVVDDGTRMGPFAAGNPANPNFNPVSFIGQRIRFEIDTSTGGNTGAIEVRVFAPATVTGETDMGDG